MDNQIIDLQDHLDYLRVSSGATTHIAIIDREESERCKIALSGWIGDAKTPTDTAPREFIRGQRLPNGWTTIAVTDDFPVLLNFLNQREITASAWVYIQRSKIVFPEHIRTNEEIPGGASVQTGKLGEATYYVAAQATDLTLAGEAIEQAVADPSGSIRALTKLSAEQSQSHR